jgi:hypothetical protein
MCVGGRIEAGDLAKWDFSLYDTGQILISRDIHSRYLDRKCDFVFCTYILRSARARALYASCVERSFSSIQMKP